MLQRQLGGAIDRSYIATLHRLRKRTAATPLHPIAHQFAVCLRAHAAASFRLCNSVFRPKILQKFTIDCNEPASDEIFDIASFEKFLHDRIKVDGKTSNLQDLVTIQRDAYVVTVSTRSHMSKRYIKYLTKKFLKKQLLRDYIRVIAKSKQGYNLKYYNFNNEAEEQEE